MAYTHSPYGACCSSLSRVLGFEDQEDKPHTSMQRSYRRSFCARFVTLAVRQVKQLAKLLLPVCGEYRRSGTRSLLPSWDRPSESTRSKDHQYAGLRHGDGLLGRRRHGLAGPYSDRLLPNSAAAAKARPQTPPGGPPRTSAQPIHRHGCWLPLWWYLCLDMLGSAGYKILQGQKTRMLHRS